MSEEDFDIDYHARQERRGEAAGRIIVVAWIFAWGAVFGYLGPRVAAWIVG